MPDLLPETAASSDPLIALAGRLRALVTDRLTRRYQEVGKFGAVGLAALAVEITATALIALPDLPRLEVDTTLGVANSTVGGSQ
ncbi:MAG TPA: hypothetical protein VK453_06090 [Micromonosporaceae bacterium]|nr:hypothetical protein [Micromonosporaceae bacterium]